MVINLTEKVINGSYNSTVVYTIENFRLEGTDNIKWDGFKFYTPDGSLVEAETKYKYFDVSSELYPIERHATLGKTLIIKVDEANGLMAQEIEDGAKGADFSMGTEGDVIITGYIPSTKDGSDIEIQYKKVIGG